MSTTSTVQGATSALLAGSQTTCPKTSFTPTVKVAVFFDGHFDGQNGMQLIFLVKVAATIETLLNFYGHGDGDIV